MTKLRQKGFTIVELLMVIVIIGILASITLVSYSGIKNLAIDASLKSDLSNASNLLKIYQANNSNFPMSTDDANDGKGIKFSQNATHDYAKDNGTIPQTFCLDAIVGSRSYNVNQDGQITFGPCPIFNVDAYSTSSHMGPVATWSDFSGYANNGTLTNGPTFSTNNVVFDGIDDYVLIHASASLNALSSNISIMAWVYPTTTDNLWRRIISRDSYPNQNWYIEFNGSTPGKLEYNGGSSNSTLSLNTWYQIVVIYNGTKVNSYVNGSLDRSSDYINLAASNADIGIGGDPNGGNNGNFAGKISSVAIYNRALTSADVQQIFAGTKNHFGY